MTLAHKLRRAWPPAGGGAFAFEWTDTAVVADVAGTATFTNRAIGAAASDRYVVAAITTTGNVVTFGTVTIGGVTATALTGAIQPVTSGGEPCVRLYWAPVPNGTTATVVVPSSAGAGVNVSCTLGRLVGHNTTVSDTDSATSGSAASIAGSALTIPAGGCGVFIAKCSAVAAFTWTNATEYADASTSDGQYSAASSTTAGTPTVTADGGTGEYAYAAAAFAPA